MEQLIIYLLNVNELYRNDKTGETLRQTLKCLLNTFTDIGVLVDTRFPHDIDTVLFDEMLKHFGCLFIKLNENHSVANKAGVYCQTVIIHAN